MSDQRSGGGGRPPGGGGIAEKLRPSAGPDGIVGSVAPIRTLPGSRPDPRLSRPSAAETSLSTIAVASPGSSSSVADRPPGSESGGETRPPAYRSPGSAGRVLAGHHE